VAAPFLNWVYTAFWQCHIEDPSRNREQIRAWDGSRTTLPPFIIHFNMPLADHPGWLFRHAKCYKMSLTVSLVQSVCTLLNVWFYRLMCTQCIQNHTTATFLPNWRNIPLTKLHEFFIITICPKYGCCPKQLTFFRCAVKQMTISFFLWFFEVT